MDRSTTQTSAHGGRLSSRANLNRSYIECSNGAKKGVEIDWRSFRMSFTYNVLGDESTKVTPSEQIFKD